MIVPLQYTHLGHDFLDKVNSYQKHSGVDLNFGKPTEDLNMPVKAMANGQVVFAANTGKGWGNLVVVYHPAYGVWSRYAHLNKIEVSNQDRIKEGQVIGLCGATGGNWSPHLHWDVIIKELKKWTDYTSFMATEKIKEYYVNPLLYVGRINEEEKKEEPIVKWHKENKIIEQWSSPPTPDELKLGFALYKMGRAIVNEELSPEAFNLNL